MTRSTDALSASRGHPRGRSRSSADAVPQSEPDANTNRYADYEDFCRREWVFARRLAFVICADVDLAEDIAQESLSRLQVRFDGLSNPRGYLRRVVVNQCTRELRKVSRQRSEPGETGRHELDGAVATELLDLIDRLPPRQRVVIVLRYYEDLSELEIARTLRCRPGTVKSLAARALVRLRKELSR